MTEPQYQCPKCHLPFPASTIHAHFTDCKGLPQQSPQYPIYNPAPIPQQYYQPQVYVPPPHQHILIENDSFKWCADPACSDKHKYLRLKMKGTWFLFVRYGLKLFWIQFLISIVLALGLVSAFHVGR